MVEFVEAAGKQFCTQPHQWKIEPPSENVEEEEMSAHCKRCPATRTYLVDCPDTQGNPIRSSTKLATPVGPEFIEML